MRHYTVEEIMSMPGYCRDHYERDIQRLEKQIAEFKEIAVHIQEHCCDDCEDTTMCEFGCAITQLKEALNGNNESERRGALTGTKDVVTGDVLKPASPSPKTQTEGKTQ